MLAPILARSANVSRAAKEKAALAGDNSDFVPILVQGAGFEPAKPKVADLQSAVFDRSTTPAKIYSEL